MPSICLLYGFAVALGGFPAAKAFEGARHLSQEREFCHNENCWLLSLGVGHDGSVWIGADHAGGVYRFKDEVFTHFDARDGLTNVAIQVIYEDRLTNLWIGTT